MKAPGERATLADWANHLSSIFPEVRLKRYLEMRGPDVGPPDRIVAMCPKLEAARGGKQTGRIVAWSLAAACSIVLVTVFGIPLTLLTTNLP